MKNGMKKLTLITTLLASMIAVPTASLAATPKPIDQSRLKLSLEVLVNARKVQFPDVKPMQKDNRILVPLRFVSDKLGGKLTLVGKDITIIKGDRTVNLTIGAKTATANGQTITLDVAANAVNGRTMVPLRFISEALGETVDWDSINQFVWIGNKNVPAVDEIMAGEDLNKFKDYYKGYIGENFLQEMNLNQQTKIFIVKRTDLPVKIGHRIYFRIDRAYDLKGQTYIREASEDYKAPGGIFLNQKGVMIRGRRPINELGENTEGVRVDYFRLVDSVDKDLYGDKNYNTLKLSDIDYFTVDDASAFNVLIKNDLI